MQSLLAAWRVSLHRTRADWPIIAAAWLIVLLAATLLAAGPIYSNAVSLAGLHRVLHDAPIADANIEVTARVDPAEAPASLDEITAQLHALARGTTVDVVASGRTDSYTLPGQDPEQVHDLVIFGFLEGIEEHATLLAGAWPLSGGADMQVAIAEPTAETLGLQVGDQLSLLSRLEADRTLDVVVAGTYRINDPAEAYWWGDPTLVDGMEESPQYRTFGPLIATRDDLLARAAGNTVPLTWHAFPRIDELGIEQIGPLRAGLHALPSRVEETTPGRFPRVRTGLDEILEASERALLVSWTGILLLMAQLAILAGYALVLTAALIVDHRRLDTALLRSRGAGPAQMAGLALAEGLLLAVPAGLAGPWLATAGLRGLNLAGPLAGIGLEIEPRVTGDAYLAAGAAAVACALLLVLPALFAARSFASEQSGRSRYETRTMGQRLGLDVALLALTAVGIWQLRLYGAPLTRTVHGALGLDPLLVAAPAIGLLAGGVVALRLLPLLAQAAEGLLARGRDLVGSLGTRQLARRPLRYTRASLLLMLAMSMGIFAVSYATTWITSQRDQANYQVGADLRVTPATGPAALPGWSLATAYTSAAGVSLAMPVERGRAQYRQGGSAGELLALDPAAAGQTVAIRADLASTSLATLFDPLARARPAVDTVRLAGRPQRLLVQATLSIDALEGDPQFRPPDPIDLATLSGESLLTASVYLLDARGLVYRFDATASPYEAGAQEIVVPLGGRTTAAQAAISAAGASFEYPIQVIGVDLVVSLPRTTHATAGTVGLTGIASSETRDGSDWQPLDLGASDDWQLGWSVGPGSPIAVVPRDLIVDRGMALGQPGEFAALPGVDRAGNGVTVSFIPRAIVALASTEVGAVVNQALLDDTATQVGDRVRLPLEGGARDAVVVGTVGSFPTTDPARPLAIIDLSTLNLLRFQAAHAARSPTEWWLKADDAAAAAAISPGASGPFARAAVISRIDRIASLSADPLALGIIGALALGFVVAGLFAVIGLASSAAVSARQRRSEFALLRALGLSGGQLSGWLWLENASLVLISLLAGTGLGLLIGWIVLPYITVTRQAGVPFPPVIVETPWASILVLEAVSAAALGVTVVALASVLRRSGVGSVLRMGGD